MVAFHEIRQLAIDTLSQLQAKPEFAREARSAESHYRDNYPYLHAVSVLLLSKDAIEAARRIGRERSLQPHVARTVLSDTVVNGPDWLKEPDYLYARGLMWAGKKYQVVPDDLKKGSSFDTARRQLLPSIKPLMEQIIAATFSNPKIRDDITLGPASLQYAAAQLMEEGAEKKIRFDALSLDRKIGDHQKYIAQSARAVSHFAKELGVDLAAFNVVINRGEPVNRIQIKDNIAIKQGQPSFSLASASRTSPVNSIAMDKTQLYQSLERLVRQGEINGQEARVYYYLSAATGKHGPTHDEAAKKYDLSVREVRDTFDKVFRLLDAPKTPSREKLAMATQ